MIESNIFRPLPLLQKKEEIDPIDGVVIQNDQDPQWPFLRPIYELFLHLIQLKDISIERLNLLVDDRFIYRLIDLFNSQMSSEREYLQQILRKIYARLIAKRRNIRRAMNQYLFELINGEEDRQNGAAELLEIYQSIISGYVVPLRNEHIEFLQNIIVPLHKSNRYTTFADQLVPCCLIFIVKSPNIGVTLLDSILKFWPFAHHEKEKLFLNEIREILRVMDPALVKPVIPQLFLRIKKCLGSQNLFVSDCALCFFEDQQFIKVVSIYRSTIYPIIVPLVEELSKDHWYKLLTTSFSALKQLLQE